MQPPAEPRLKRGGPFRDPLFNSLASSQPPASPGDHDRSGEVAESGKRGSHVNQSHNVFCSWGLDQAILPHSFLSFSLFFACSLLSLRLKCAETQIDPEILGVITEVHDELEHIDDLVSLSHRFHLTFAAHVADSDQRPKPITTHDCWYSGTPGQSNLHKDARYHCPCSLRWTFRYGTLYMSLRLTAVDSLGLSSASLDPPLGAHALSSQLTWPASAGPEACSI